MFFGGDPFEHFAHASSGRSRGSRHGPSGDVDTKLYETLGVEKTATGQEIKRAYRKLAVVHHPDKGGDEQKFKEINAAYEILSDSEKRAKYDKYGLEGLDAEGGGSADATDLFSMFFGGGHSSRNSGPRKGEDINHPIRVSLADLYSGKTVKLAVNRQVIDGKSRECTRCDGTGVIVELRQIALGMVQQIQRHCPDCQGEGHVYKKKKERKILEVLIEPGMKHNEKITFRGLGDEKPNIEPGNVNFVVQEEDHPTFKRKGADLLMTKKLSLKEAITGFAFKMTHLDGRDLVVQSKPGEVIKAEADGGKPFVKVIPNEGMPSRGNPFIKGGLYVMFSVEFPRDGELPDEALALIRKALPGPEMETNFDHEQTEVVHLETADVKFFGKGGVQKTQSEYDSDDSGSNRGGAQQVQCQQS